jgi:GNAT superfamily N-acetyltransferase
MNPAFRIATMNRDEVGFAIRLAADEGWNPGLHDAASFQAADPDGFLVGRLDGEPIGCVSAVSYPGQFGFIGLYIVVPRCRGRGYGIQLWRAAMERLAGHNVGLDGVFAQQDNYKRSGFRMANSNIRYERAGPLASAPAAEIIAIARVPFATVTEYDRLHFPAMRESFLRHWIAQPDSAALAHFAHGRLQGYGVIRKCVQGHKIGPLFADHEEIAEQLYLALCRRAGVDEPVYLDVPEVNDAGLNLAEKYGMKKVFGTARMYTGELPRIPQKRVFGVTTFELG